MALLSKKFQELQAKPAIKDLTVDLMKVELPEEEQEVPLEEEGIDAQLAIKVKTIQGK